MSADASAAGHVPQSMRCPSTAAASVSACAGVRLVTSIRPTPCARRCCAVSVLDLSGAHHQHASALQPAEDLARQRHRGVAHRHGAFAERGLAAHALADAERPVKQPAQHRPGALALGRHLERVLHLAQDLRLADDQRVEARRHPEQVPRRRRSFELEQVRHERVGASWWYWLRNSTISRRGLRRIVAGDVDLGAVAGREHHRLGGRGSRGQRLHRRAEIAAREVELLPQPTGAVR